ncbi:MAG TPA: SpoIIE family protein phosphatase [Candidatus Ozemobacteraceae bacterium]|nr:SpoIIE family protein phosphatase [Candidatus Ozemobacteraceae bacterium]
MGYLHVEVDAASSAKKNAAACGDVWTVERTPEATTILLSDGLGSGVKASVAAQMAVSRMIELLHRGFSVRQAFSRVVHTMHEARGTDLPYAVLSVIRLLNTGEATVLVYEMPTPLYVSRNTVLPVQMRTITLETELVGEASLFLEPGEGILLMSDGITQAGLGKRLKLGWTTEGVRRFLDDCRSDGLPMDDLARLVHDQARIYWEGPYGDDCTTVCARVRSGIVLNIFTGPPCVKNLDGEIAGRFMQMPGRHIVCGATTAQIVARRLGRPLEMEQNQQSLIAPPAYRIEGVDLVTEGAVTLNQVFNILDADPSEYEPDTGVTQLCQALREADRINILVGRAANDGHADIAFRQRGIMPRTAIVPLLIDRLRAAGKLVVPEWV